MVSNGAWDLVIIHLLRIVTILMEIFLLLLVIWKVIRPLLSPAQQKAVVFVRKAEIQDYIDKDQLWPHMGGTVSGKYIRAIN